MMQDNDKKLCVKHSNEKTNNSGLQENNVYEQKQPTVTILLNPLSSDPIACFHNWDTAECIDGYNLYEVRKMQQKLDDVVSQMISYNPQQLLLF